MPAAVIIVKIKVISKDNKCEFKRSKNPVKPIMKYANPFIEFIVLAVNAIYNADIAINEANM